MRRREDGTSALRDEERRIGLARSLSKLGYCSRSRAAELIRAGKVRLNGRVQRDPEFPTNQERDRFEIDGVGIYRAQKLYIMMNKSRGLVTSTRDEKSRATVYSLLPPDLPWVSPVGRLDKASEGLLLLTNDSEWAARIADPATHLDKTYHVQVDTVPDESLIDQLRRGVVLQGELLHAKQVRGLRSGKKNGWLEIVLDEGKNRQIRRMLEAMCVQVLRLVRVAIGPLQLGGLPKGGWRMLADREKSILERNAE